MNDELGSCDKTIGLSPVPTPPREVLHVGCAGKRVMVVFPWMKQTNPMTAYSIMRLVDTRRHSMMLNFGDAFVVHARNNCADVFLGSHCEWMLTIDDDMVVPFGNAEWFNAHTGFDLPKEYAGLHALERLLSHGKMLVGGLYFGRHSHGAPMYSEGANNPTEAAYARKAPMNVLKPTRWVATGCLLIHRTVFEDIEKKYPALARLNGKGGQWFTSSEHILRSGIDALRKKLAVGPFDGAKAFMAFTELENLAAEARANSGLGMGEDVAFCVRAKAAGHQPYVDMGLVCGHVGMMVYGPKNTSIKLPCLR